MLYYTTEYDGNNLFNSMLAKIKLLNIKIPLYSMVQKRVKYKLLQQRLILHSRKVVRKIEL